MTIWFLVFLVGFNLIIGFYQVLGGYVANRMDFTLEVALMQTPLKPFVSDSSALSGGLGGWNPLSALAFGWDAMTVIWNMTSFKYEIFNVDGVIGDLGTVLTLVGRACGAFLLFQFARSIAGAAGFTR